MTDVVYLMGAGASFGKRRNQKLSSIIDILDERNNVFAVEVPYANIIEGMPVVTEIPGRILYICYIIRNSDSSLDLTNISNKPTSLLEDTKKVLLRDLRWLYDGAIKHATIDTFAKKLFLTGKTEEYNKLKKLLAIYFIIEQIINKPDSRYDTFLANILTPNLEIPERMKILTWNYDSQFEIAFNEYKSQINTPRDIGCYSLHDNDLTIQPSIFKINGTASFKDWGSLANVKNNSNKLSKEVVDKIIKAYKDDISLLSFAWENTGLKNSNTAVRTFIQNIQFAKTLVVIGYTFPFFNRLVDKEIIGSLNNLKKVYIQDPRADEVAQSIDAVLASSQKPPINPLSIIPITNCNQFYLPAEL